MFNKRQSGEENDTVYRAVKAALANGYRHIDTAMMVTRQTMRVYISPKSYLFFFSSMVTKPKLVEVFVMGSRKVV